MPNYDSASRVLLRARWHAGFPLPDHMTFFITRTLGGLLAACGSEPVAISTSGFDAVAAWDGLGGAPQTPAAANGAGRARVTRAATDDRS